MFVITPIFCKIKGIKKLHARNRIENTYDIKRKNDKNDKKKGRIKPKILNQCPQKTKFTPPKSI